MAVTRDPIPAAHPSAAEPAPQVAAETAAPATAVVAPSPQAPATRPPAAAGPRAIALGLLAIGVIALVATFAVPAGAGSAWAPSGARFFPLVASVGLIVLSLAFLARVTVWPDTDLAAHAAEEAAQTEWAVPALVAAGLIGYVVLIEPLGYVLASALFFPLVARVLGSRSPRRDVLAGVTLSVALYLLFTRLLGVPLPPGLLGF